MELDDGGAGGVSFGEGLEVAADPELVGENTARVSKVVIGGFDDGAAVLDVSTAAATEVDDIDVGLLESGIGGAAAVLDGFDVENKDESEVAKEDEDELEG